MSMIGWNAIVNGKISCPCLQASQCLGDAAMTGLGRDLGSFHVIL
jgi:hypothetical protein